MAKQIEEEQSVCMLSQNIAVFWPALRRPFKRKCCRIYKYPLSLGSLPAEGKHFLLVWPVSSSLTEGL